jgi:hypothetical protein
MIISTSGIYGKIFRLFAFVIQELDKIQFVWGAPSCLPHLNTFTRLSVFFELTAMLTAESPTSSKSFIPFWWSRCKLWYTLQRITPRVSKLREVHSSISSIHSMIRTSLCRSLPASNIYWKYFSKIPKNSRIIKFSRWEVCIPPGLKGLRR